MKPELKLALRGHPKQPILILTILLPIFASSGVNGLVILTHHTCTGHTGCCMGCERNNYNIKGYTEMTYRNDNSYCSVVFVATLTNILLCECDSSSHSFHHVFLRHVCCYIQLSHCLYCCRHNLQDHAFKLLYSSKGITLGNTRAGEVIANIYTTYSMSLD